MLILAFQVTVGDLINATIIFLEVLIILTDTTVLVFAVAKISPPEWSGVGKYLYLGYGESGVLSWDVLEPT